MTEISDLYEQKTCAVRALQALIEISHSHPAHKCHCRVRPELDAAIESLTGAISEIRYEIEGEFGLQTPYPQVAK
jgi:hypothetical protein